MVAERRCVQLQGTKIAVLDEPQTNECMRGTSQRMGPYTSYTYSIVMGKGNRIIWKIGAKQESRGNEAIKEQAMGTKS